MKSYLFAYGAPTDYQPTGPDSAQPWHDWFLTLGDRLLDVGNPGFARTELGGAGGGTRLGGYSAIRAESLDEAPALAAGCPFLAIGGGVEVGEITRLNPDSLTATLEDHARILAAR
jgi:hypothetical protein